MWFERHCFRNVNITGKQSRGRQSSVHHYTGSLFQEHKAPETPDPTSRKQQLLYMTALMSLLGATHYACKISQCILQKECMQYISAIPIDIRINNPSLNGATFLLHGIGNDVRWSGYACAPMGSKCARGEIGVSHQLVCQKSNVHACQRRQRVG